MLLNLDEFREQHFYQRATEFLNTWRTDYRFHDQSVFNFLLHQQIDELPEYWNRASWRFDAQQHNDLACVLHYTASAPWLGGPSGPAQVLFEQFAAQAGLPMNRQTADFKTSRRQQLLRNLIAPFRAVGFPIVSLFYKIAGQQQKSAAYQKAGRYWRDYIIDAPQRRRLHQRRAEEIQRMIFKRDVSRSRA
jgi:hypothetical protein